MLVFPQLSTGSLAQFPIRKRKSYRTRRSETSGGNELRATDVDASAVRWELRYEGLSDGEKQSIEDLFLATQGRLRSFVFVDVTANLLARSEDLDGADWVQAPLTEVASGVSDPFGGTRGWLLRNNSAVQAGVSQATRCPGGLQYCFSIYARSTEQATSDVVLRIAADGVDVCRTERAGKEWKRMHLTSAIPPSTSGVTFGFEVPAGGSVEVYGPQVDAQPYPSEYKSSVTSGVYPGARFDDDVLAVQTDGMNCHSMTIHVLSKASR